MTSNRGRRRQQGCSRSSSRAPRSEGGLLDPHFNQIIIFGRRIFPREVARSRYERPASLRARRRGRRAQVHHAGTQPTTDINETNEAINEVGPDHPQGLEQPNSDDVSFTQEEEPTPDDERDDQPEPPHYTDVPQPGQQQRQRQQWLRERQTRKNRPHNHRQPRPIPLVPDFTSASDSSDSPSSPGIAYTLDSQGPSRVRKRDRIAKKVCRVLGLRKGSKTEDDDDFDEYSQDEEHSDDLEWEEADDSESLDDLMTPAVNQRRDIRVVNMRRSNAPLAQNWSMTSTPRSSYVNSVASSTFQNDGVYIDNSDTSRPSTASTSGPQRSRPRSSNGAITPQSARRGRVSSRQQQEQRQQRPRPQLQQFCLEPRLRAGYQQVQQQPGPRTQSQYRQQQEQLQQQPESPVLGQPHTHWQARPELRRQPRLQPEQVRALRMNAPLPPTPLEQDVLPQDVVIAENSNEREEHEEEIGADNNNNHFNARDKDVENDNGHKDKIDDSETMKEWNIGQIGTLVVVPAIVAFAVSWVKG